MHLPHFRLLLLFSLLLLVHSQYSLCTRLQPSSCLPCPSSCTQCSSPTICTGCVSSYFYSPSLCTPCPQNCLNCTNLTQCTQCSPFYFLSLSTCMLCLVPNAYACSSASTATLCLPSFYLSNGNCLNCLLNCLSCTSFSTCTQCVTGFYLNNTVLTCNPCTANCINCTATACTTCAQGYSLTTNCIAIPCLIPNCLYCSTTGICAACLRFFYLTNNQCVVGSSVSCATAYGILPTQCTTCPTFSLTLLPRCLPYPNLHSAPNDYTQLYYYAYNDYDTLTTAAQLPNTPLTLLPTHQYALSVTSLQFTLPTYYRLTIALKYTPSPTTIFITAAPGQNQSTALPSTGVFQYNTTIVHSNTVKLTSNTTWNIIEIWIRAYNCPKQCLQCLNIQLCELCIPPLYSLNYFCVTHCLYYYHFTANMTCVINCPPNYYPLSNNSYKACIACTPPCLTCADNTSCLSCTPPFYYFNYSCVTTCPDSYYADTDTCTRCLSPCALCLNSTHCLSCAVGFWNGTLCTTLCPDGTFANTTAKACQPCSIYCLTCAESPTTCTTCTAPLLLYNPVCLTNCPAGNYPTAAHCLQCQPPCLTCLTATHCLSCAYNYLLNATCTATCPPGNYPDIVNALCGKCPLDCEVCTSPTTCIQCNAGCMHLGTCLSSCPSTLYFPLVITFCTCTPCLFPCGHCLNATTCTTCLEGYLLNSTCLTLCPPSMYPDELHSLCTLCTTTFNHCLLCTPLTCIQCLTPFILANHSCVALCPLGTFTTPQQCITCIYPCLQCSSSTQCTLCSTPYSLQQQSCVLQCALGTTSVAMPNTQCIACIPPCRSCAVSPSSCTYCIAGYYRANDSCVLDCTLLPPSNNYFNELSSLTCSSCVAPCLTCSSRSLCTSCRVGSLTPQGTCQQCPLSTYSAASVCLPCPSPCSACFSATLCTACSSAYLLFNQCVSDPMQCQLAGYYALAYTCYLCAAPCKTCTNTSTQCLTCFPGYLFIPPSQCLTQCPQGQYATHDTCALCDAACATCQDTLCYSCNKPFLLLLSTLTCLATCPTHTFPLGTTCRPCLYPCRTCQDATLCLSCIDGALSNNTCNSLCPSNTYLTPSSQCLNCAPPCSQCSLSPSNCTQCPPSHYLLTHLCLTLCPTTHFPQNQSQQCLPCPPSCLSCTSYIDCQSCTTPLLYYHNPTLQIGECLTTCPTASFPHTSTCTPCPKGCLQCSSTTKCNICAGDKVQLEGECVDSCLPNMYSRQGVCTTCNSPCAECIDASTCTSCIIPTDLLAASSCLSTTICPLPYYRIAGQMRCELSCPTPYYARTDSTCGLHCAQNQFIGNDSKCYPQCPSNYSSNATYHCLPCNPCNGLYFQLSSFLIRQTLYILITFTQTPRIIQQPQITLQPPYSFTIVNDTPHSYSQNTQILLLVDSNASLVNQRITITFLHSFATFTNPLQINSQTIIIAGYDHYDEVQTDMTLWGVIALFGGIFGLFSNPFLTDFAQILYLQGLIDYHYSPSLSNFLSKCSIAHLYGLITLAPLTAQTTSHKIADPSLLKHAIFNYLIIAISLIVALLLFILYIILRKALSYHKVHPQIQSIQNVNRTHSNIPTSSCKITLYNSLEVLFSRFSLLYLNRVIYFNYYILTLFSLTQLVSFSTSTAFETLSSTLAILTLILIVVYPLTTKPKFTFLYARKFITCIAIIISQKDSLYAVGVISVCNVGAAILILTHRLEKYRCDSYILAAGEILQLCIQLTLSICIMIGEGSNSQLKMGLMAGVLYACIALLAAYILHTLSEVICNVVQRCGGTNCKENWITNKEIENQETNHSETISNSMKEHLSNKSIKTDTNDKIKKILQMLNPTNNPPQPNDAVDIEEPQQFFAYRDDSQSEKDAPQMLIRCVNQISDFGENQSAKQ